MDSKGDDRRAFLRQSALMGGAALGGVGMAGGLARAEALAATIGASAEQRVLELGLVIPRIESQVPTIVPAVRVGNLLYVSGQGPREEDGRFVTGKVGADLDVDAGYRAARLVAQVTLGVIRTAVGSLDNVARVVKVLGMVNATPDFAQQPRVINGYSELLIDVFGDRGRGARSAVGVASLPNNWAVEVEGIFEIR